MQSVIVMLAALLVAVPLSAQASRTSREAMQALAFLTGEWTGKAAMIHGGQMDTVDQKEWVHYAAGGTVLVIRGEGSRRLPDGQKQVVHDALATIHYDADAKQYRMRTFVAIERSAVPEIEVRPDTVIWTLAMPNDMRTRYTIWRDADGRWQERGETSRNGGPWVQFFRMWLDKVADR